MNTLALEVTCEQPFSVDDFLEKLAAGAPELALDPAIEAGLQRLNAAVHAQGPGRPPVLLLIDDDDADAEMFENALKQNGVTMDVARVRDGREALDYFEGNHAFADRRRFPLPHLIILDLKLPELSGVEVLKRMRQLPKCNKLAVIVLTSSRTKPDMTEFSNLNVSAYLYKPDTFSAMVEIVEQIKQSWLTVPALRKPDLPEPNSGGNA